jgi:ATP/maltotriose-dependent transcriptional regulator MalT
MPARVVSREVEARAVGDFLSLVVDEPSALVIEGEAGIGKTTLWLAGLTQARDRGFTVLSTRPVAAESVLAYASLADLLGALDAAVWDNLPTPQRFAMDGIMFRADTDGAVIDHRAVAAGFLSAVEWQAEESPVLLAVDDLQWLDPSSAGVLAFAVRRLSGPVGVFGTVRIEPDAPDASWLQMPRPDAIRRIGVPPMSLGGLHAVISERLGRSFPRPAMVWIHEVSGGNPFYALELARKVDTASSSSSEEQLPGTLADLVRTRIGHLDPEAKELLLAAACAAAPTTALLTSATGGTPAQVVRLLEDAERKGIIVIDGHRVYFAHPLLARGVYTDADPAARRAMHGRLADIVTEPELQARHLARAAVGADQRTLKALDDAAESARIRGAPAAAAELLDLAVALGGDTPQRRIGSAGHHFKAGETARARSVLDEVIKDMEPGPLRAEALNLLAVIRLSDDSFADAAGLLEHSLDEAGDDFGLRVQMLISLSFSLLNLGRQAEALGVIDDAVKDAERQQNSHLRSQALSVRVILRFMLGEGLDEADLRRALALEDRRADTPLTVRSHVHSAMLQAWTGRLEDAHREIQAIRRRCIESGDESELMFVAFHSVLIEMWRGNFTDAGLVAEDTMERALQLNTEVPQCQALSMRAALDAYAGRVDEARRDASEALSIAVQCGSPILMAWPLTTLGFVEVSTGDHHAALTTLAPLLATFDAVPDATEIVLAWCLPDALEALISVGRGDDADALIARIERNGRRLDRAWMLAVAARARSMLLAAQGDVAAARRAAEQAMAQHDRLPMPFERARTQLLLGQLQRRQGNPAAAAETFNDALRQFEELGTPLWAERVRAELGRTNVGPRGIDPLTPAEQRVAELAASGMTNRAVAAALFISPKTVEANLARVYRKLDIHSRAELGRRMGASDT